MEIAGTSEGLNGWYVGFPRLKPANYSGFTTIGFTSDGLITGGTIPGLTTYGYVLLRAITGSITTGYIGLVTPFTPPPGQITPKPHSMPNRTNNNPNNSKGSQHIHPPQIPFFTGLSC